MIFRLFEYFRPSTVKSILLWLLLSSLTGISELLSISLILPIFGTSFQNGNPSSFFFDVSRTQLIVGIVAVLLIQAALRFSNLHYTLKIANLCTTDLASRSYSNILRQEYKYFRNNLSTDQLVKLTSLLAQISSVFQNILNVYTQSLTSLLILAYLIYASPTSTISTLVVVIFFYSISNILLRGRHQRYSFELPVFQKKIAQILNDSLQNIKQILIDGSQDKWVEDFDNSYIKLRSVNRKAQFTIASPKILAETIFTIVLLTFVLVLVTSESETGKWLPLLLIYAYGFQKVLPMAQSIYASVAIIKVNYGSSSDILSLLQLPIHYKNEKIWLANTSRRQHSEIIQLKHVTFSYNSKSDSPVLSNVSITINQGDKIAITGPSGCGKSSLVSILAGLEKPTSGSIYLAGDLVPHSQLQYLNDLCTLVPQQIYLRCTSVFDNITNYQSSLTPMLTLDEITSITGLDDLVSRDFSLHMPIGENGALLSGGQKQRIAIARALYRSKPILILDEATNALDRPSELKILDNILSITDLTVILVTHNHDLLTQFDQVFSIYDHKLRLSTY